MASFNRQLTKLRKSPPNQHNKNPSENPSTDLSAWFLITCGICANNQKEIDKYPLSSDRFARNFTVSPEKAPCLNISAACSISVCAHSPTHPLTNQLYQLYQLYQLLYQQSCVKNPQTTKPKAKKLRSRGSDNRALADNRFEFEGFFTLWLDYAAYIFTQRDIVRCYISMLSRSMFTNAGPQQMRSPLARVLIPVRNTRTYLSLPNRCRVIFCT